CTEYDGPDELKTESCARLRRGRDRARLQEAADAGDDTEREFQKLLRFHTVASHTLLRRSFSDQRTIPFRGRFRFSHLVSAERRYDHARCDPPLVRCLADFPGRSQRDSFLVQFL